ncbi:14519_t:CDS:2 [Cetraspora pellucida]|uniref:14519_t:CDS:1 n=1 Tax=Cetraspora pellucida TaxID=1433469 RepID=A0A9N9NEE2_9GLOM|nr:14519_t:CDS:2 [Cetraspora pellucida]
MKEDENVIEEVVMYLDSLVTMINPGLNAPIPNCHLCKKRLEELKDDLQDYTELHRNIKQLTENGTIEWSNLFTCYYKEINADGNNILGLAVDNEDEITDNKDEVEKIEDDEQEECQHD